VLDAVLKRVTMIFFYGEGRLGNQVFQYQALNHIARQGERIFAFGLEDLQKYLRLNGPRLSVIGRNRSLKRLVKYVLVPALVRPLCRTLHLFNHVVEPLGGSDGVEPSGLIVTKRGLFPGITFVDGGHYQDSSLWTRVFPTPLFEVKPTLRAAAREFLRGHAGAGRAAFVHVRRGDYLAFSQHGLESVALPLSYYQKAIRELEHRLGRFRLVFVTDDAPWVHEHFRQIEDKIVASFDAAMDFAIMTECRAGIVSNSTFALGAAFLMVNPDLVIVPRYWFGFGKKFWSPPRIFCPHPKVLDVAVDD